MKVEKKSSITESSRSSFDPRRSQQVKAASSAFDASLFQEQQKRRTSQLWQEVESASNELKRKVDLISLRRYQEQVRRFLHHVIGGAYQINDKNVRDNRGRVKQMSLIKVVDQHLEELASMVMAEEKDRLAILGRIDQIRGMLIDLEM